MFKQKKIFLICIKLTKIVHYFQLEGFNNWKSAEDLKMVKISEHFSKHQLHKMVDVKISHVYSPEEFWVQRCDRNSRLGALEEEMFKFYEDEDNNKSIEEMPFPGRFELIKYPWLLFLILLMQFLFWKLQ